MLEPTQKTIDSRPPGSAFFSDDRSQHNADVLSQLPPTDVLHLHWVAGVIDHRSFFRALPRGLPVVWTLHDMNPFTGGCHFDEGCGKFRDHCGACPQLYSLSEKDFSFRAWSRKRTAFSALQARRIHLVAPSRWLATEVKRSALLSSLEVRVIPYGIDTGKFQPRDAHLAREKFGIPPEARVVLFVADWMSDTRKGLSMLLEALRQPENTENLYLVTIGHGQANQEFGVRCKAIEFVSDETMLSFAYSAADLFVLPSLQDNLPNTALEALACGVPTVAFHVGGVPEIVRNGQTGMTVTPRDPKALRRAIEELLGSPERRRQMSANCRRVAVQEYALEVQARQYVELYALLLALAPEAAGMREGVLSGQQRQP